MPFSISVNVYIEVLCNFLKSQQKTGNLSELCVFFETVCISLEKGKHAVRLLLRLIVFVVHKYNCPKQLILISHGIMNILKKTWHQLAQKHVQQPPMSKFVDHQSKKKVLLLSDHNCVLTGVIKYYL